MGFVGRLEAIRAPTIVKGRKGSKAYTGVLIPPVPQLMGGCTGRVATYSATPATNMDAQSPASDQAS